MIPTVSWGNTEWDSEDITQWELAICDDVVGGKTKKNCGMYIYLF